jgi:hypothetical protein
VTVTVFFLFNSLDDLNAVIMAAPSFTSPLLPQDHHRCPKHKIYFYGNCKNRKLSAACLMLHSPLFNFQLRKTRALTKKAYNFNSTLFGRNLR